ncbi:hypothetical protein GCM10010145_44320 [Streptomyces ruber]|uniref:Uncharacterized protein n=2 Tax=Streptomyces TaxID=1883 RepID=A0A918BHP0_9ACTN|nr:hypothetical protein GCM10010145_44320 [Streptomyces ruber]
MRRETGWTPGPPGSVELPARATDGTGRTQPERSAHNTQGRLFDAVVRHPATAGRDPGCTLLRPPGPSAAAPGRRRPCARRPAAARPP